MVSIMLAGRADRREDVPLLAGHFIREFAGDDKSFTAEALECLCRHSWPGNVRELRNVMERVALFSRSPEITADDVRAQIRPGAPVSSASAGIPFSEAKGRFEREYFGALYQEAEGNVSEAARRAKMDRKHLREKLRQLGLI